LLARAMRIDGAAGLIGVDPVRQVRRDRALSNVRRHRPQEAAMTTGNETDAGDGAGSTETLGEDIGAGVSLIAVDLAPGGGPALHRHPYAEVFVLIEGEATFTLGAAERVVRAGEVVVAPAGVAHRFVNSGTGRLRQVDIHEHPRFQTEWL
jgi:mannose-6-phosphate isomerase-like protein (cupin superfamily)